jgi:broad-specificity NMP kinase
VIIWLNGTFGVGKTTAAELICDRTKWRMFDPEHVGYMLAANLRDIEFNDFQHLPPWRSLVPAVAKQIQHFTGSPALVAVQTVLVEGYWNELKSNLVDHGLRVFHVLLDCDADELRRRIQADEVERQAEEWRFDHIPKFHAAREWLTRSADTVVDTTHITPEDVAQLVVDAASTAISSDS